MSMKLPTVHHQFAHFFSNEEIRPYAFAVSENLEQGSICLNLKENFTSDDLDPDWEKAFLNPLQKVKVLHAQVEQDGINGNKPFVIAKDNLYITRYFKYETRILKKVRELVGNGRTKHTVRMEALRASTAMAGIKVNSNKNFKVDWQVIAATSAFLNDFTIITGGPGTGKTTTVAKVLGLLFDQDKDLKVKLAAPTGKAAMRMYESLKNNTAISDDLKEKISCLEPFTLHRLLGTRKLSPYFKHDSFNPLDADVVIVDEASMIDVAMFSKLLDAIGLNTRLIILGDQNQLASVEAGSILGDFCNSLEVINSFSDTNLAYFQNLFPEYTGEIAGVEDENLLRDNIVNLEYSYRFKSDEGIGQLSKAIIEKDYPILEEFLNGYKVEDQIKIDLDYDEGFFKNFIQKFEAYISEPDIEKALNKLNEVRVLAAVRMGKQGIYELNKRIEQFLAHKKLIKAQHIFYENRPILITRNYPELNLFNGDVGIVRNDGTGSPKVWFLGEKDKKRQLFPVSPGYITEVETVFAMTIHKSQGSEFDDVMVILPQKKELQLLTKELLYTAVTRAKKKVYISTEKEVFIEAAGRDVKRASGIGERINNPMQDYLWL